MNSLWVREWSHSSLSMMAVGNNFTSAKAENQVESAFWGQILSFPLKGQRVSLVAQRVKNLSAMWETWVRSLGWEDPVEKGMVTHSSTLAWRIPWTEEPGGLQSMGSQRVGHD